MKTQHARLALLRAAIVLCLPHFAAHAASPQPGTLDLTFTPPIAFTECGPCIDGRIQRGLLVQPDDKVLVGGEGLRRLNADGQLDTNFNSGVLNPGSALRPLVTDLALQNDGRILICGTFTNVQDTWRNGIARLHTDGRLDESFDPGNSIAGGAVQSIAWQTNGQVLIAGTFTSVNGFLRGGIARLHDDGGLDTGFNPGAGAAPTVVNSIMMQSDGAVLLAGGFTSIDGVARPGFARLHANGSLQEFNPPVTVAVSGFFGHPRLLAVQLDEKIWITGGFGGPTNLARLRADGSVDLQIARPLNNPLLSSLSLALQSDGKVLVGGRASPLARLKPDGSADPTFVAPTFLSPAFTPRGPQFIALQNDGRIVVAGDFDRVGGDTRPGLARLYGGELPYFAPAFVAGSLRHSRTGVFQFQFQMTGYPGSQIVIEATDSLGLPTWTPILTNTIGNTPITVTDTNAAFFPQRFYRLVSP